MTERESFLRRWSRNKAKAQRDTVEGPEQRSASGASPPAGTEVKPDQSTMPPQTTGLAPQARTIAKPEFDVTKLPSLESITAATDIRPFLSAGVPQELARAALRRAWAADPSIRDFVGLAENQWDFTDPAGVPGFGGILPGTDVKAMIARILGEADTMSQESGSELETPQASAMTAESASTSAAAAQPDDRSEPASGAPVARPEARLASAEPLQADVAECSADVAPQQNHGSAELPTAKRPRAHGGALPRL
jgi:hypothetical protein